MNLLKDNLHKWSISLIYRWINGKPTKVSSRIAGCITHSCQGVRNSLVLPTNWVIWSHFCLFSHFQECYCKAIVLTIEIMSSIFLFICALHCNVGEREIFFLFKSRILWSSTRRASDGINLWKFIIHQCSNRHIKFPITLIECNRTRWI